MRTRLTVILAVVALVPSVAVRAAEPGGRFLDDDGNIHAPDIEAIAAAGVTSGCNGTGDLYCPDDGVTRGQMAEFLVDAFDLPAGTGDTFDDDDGSPYEPAIESLAAAGVTRGCDEARYCPRRIVTRGEMAAFLARALGLEPPAGVDPFTDDSLFEGEIEAIHEAGITRGCAADRYCPADPVPRDQMAAFLARALGLEPLDVPERTSTGCGTGGRDDPQGATSVVGAHRHGPTDGTEFRFRVEIENGIAVDGGCVADVVAATVFDIRGWTASPQVRFTEVVDDSHDVRIVLASPDTTDRLCEPLDTAGIYSCRVGDRIVLNLDRWRTGAPEEVPEIVEYRRYPIMHEVGHWLGQDHRNVCPDFTDRAPVMMQQTIEVVGDCEPNGWPLLFEVATIGPGPAIEDLPGFLE